MNNLNVEKPFYKKPIIIGSFIGLLAIVVMALIYYFAVYKKKPTAISVSTPASAGVTIGAPDGTGTGSGGIGSGGTGSGGIGSGGTGSGGIGSGGTGSGGIGSGGTGSGGTSTAAVLGSEGITTTGVPIIATLQKADPVFAQKTMLTKLTNSKTAATNLLSKIQEIQYWTTLVPGANRITGAAFANSWLVNKQVQYVGNSGNPVSAFDYYIPMLSHIFTAVMNRCDTAIMGNPGLVGGTNCTGKGFSTAVPAAYNIIGQINAEAINYASKYLGTPLVGNTLTAQTCAVGTTCGYIPDLNNLIKSGTLHPPNIWLVCGESKDVVSKITKLTSLLTSLVTNTAWMKQLPPNGFGLIKNISGQMHTRCLTCPSQTTIGIPAWYAGFETFMTGYIKQLNALVSDVKTTAHDLGVISGYYNQTA